jgi:tetratricopeptide (TPR) repeat protein
MKGIDPERWRQLQPILDEALALPPSDRAEWLTRVCPDPELRAIIDRWLEADAMTGGVLDASPAVFLEPALLALERDAAIAFPGTERFTVLRRIGAGGMGVVYEVRDRLRDSVVALKTLARVRPADVLRLKREFRILADVVHPNLVSLYELIADDAACFFTMELVDGADVVQYVRGHATACATERAERARHILQQVASGILELHRRGTLHRDIKPSNILVTPAGRAVILDFGIASDVFLGAATSDRLAGTPAYMAPERRAGGNPDPAHDWYALGVTLYEALTGRKPTGTSLTEWPIGTHEDAPPAPSEIAPGVPGDLDAICLGLIRNDPSCRLDGRGILQLVDHGRAGVMALGGPESDDAWRFVGRRAQLDVLDAALQSARHGDGTAVYVHGPSGIGKSALTEHFLNGVSAREQVTVLRGRCYEHESLPYKGFDGVIDSLTHHLVSLRAADVEAIVPPDAAALSRLFPVIGQVHAIGPAPRPESIADDPVDSRRRAFTVARELFRRLAARRTLILWIDDFHWADTDSAMLLRDLLRPPHAPPLLVIVCFRSEEIPAQSFLARLLEETDPGGRMALPLGPMAADEARALACSAVPFDAHVEEGDVQQIADESGGNPFLLRQLARYVGRHGHAARRAATFRDMLTERVLTLPTAAQHYLQLLALCGRPMQPEIVYEACGLAGDDRHLVAQLRSDHLLRSSGSARRVELYHDRIREALASMVGAAERRRFHHSVARTLVARGAGEPEVLYEHYREAGAQDAAAAYATAAAQKADHALAFDRAAAYYRAALELAPGSSARAGWTEALGMALANAGRPTEAADAFLRATVYTDTGRQLELRRMAAEQLLSGGHIDRGLDVMRAVLRTVRIRLARSPRAALMALIARRVQLRLRGFTFAERDLQSVPTDRLLRLDTCWSVATGLGLVDMIRSAHFCTRHLLLALDSGLPDRIARALAIEAMATSGAGGPRRRYVLECIAKAESIAERSDQPYAAALCALARGVAAVQVGLWREAHEGCDQALAMLHRQRVTATWERNCAHFFSLGGRLYRGNLRHVCGMVPALLNVARDRGDLFFETELRTRMNLVWLALDRPEEGLREVNEASRRWSHAGIHRQHYNFALARIQTALYAGQPTAAWDIIAENWPAIARTHLLRMQVIRVEACYLRARAALFMAATGAGTHGFLDIAARDAGRINREQMPWCIPIAALLRAAIAHVGRKKDVAIEELGDALLGFDKADMQLYAAVARRCLGLLTGGGEGDEHRRRAADWMAGQGVVDPLRMTRLIAPGFE